jgi:hypothetical protein
MVKLVLLPLLVVKAVSSWVLNLLKVPSLQHSLLLWFRLVFFKLRAIKIIVLVLDPYLLKSLFALWILISWGKKRVLVGGGAGGKEFEIHTENLFKDNSIAHLINKMLVYAKSSLVLEDMKRLSRSREQVWPQDICGSKQGFYIVPLSHHPLRLSN